MNSLHIHTYMYLCIINVMYLHVCLHTRFGHAANGLLLQLQEFSGSLLHLVLARWHQVTQRQKHRKQAASQRGTGDSRTSFSWQSSERVVIVCSALGLFPALFLERGQGSEGGQTMCYRCPRTTLRMAR